MKQFNWFTLRINVALHLHFFIILGRIRVRKEIIKHIKYQRNVRCINGHQYFGHITVFHHAQCALCQNKTKLNLQLKWLKKRVSSLFSNQATSQAYHLNERYVTFDVDEFLLHGRTKEGGKIVWIHQHVHTWIQHNREQNHATWNESIFLISLPEWWNISLTYRHYTWPWSNTNMLCSRDGTRATWRFDWFFCATQRKRFRRAQPIWADTPGRCTAVWWRPSNRPLDSWHCDTSRIEPPSNR